MDLPVRFEYWTHVRDGGYQIVGVGGSRVVRPIKTSADFKEINVLEDQPTLYSAFANIKTDADIVAFADQNGLVGVGFDVRLGGEDTKLWDECIRDLNFSINALRGILKHDSGLLSNLLLTPDDRNDVIIKYQILTGQISKPEYFRRIETAGKKSMEEAEKEFGVFAPLVAPYRVREELKVRQLGKSDSLEPETELFALTYLAHEEISDLINKNLKGSFSGCFPKKFPEDNLMVLMPSNLIAALWLQFSICITGQGKMPNKCLYCGGWFNATRSDKKYCKVSHRVRANQLRKQKS